jgi:phospholipid transport system substrate-binding protein
MTRRMFIKVFAILILMSANSVPTQAASPTPSEVVTQFQALLIDTMKVAENTTVRERYELLQPGVIKSFHLALMTQIATGRFWKQATKSERADVAKAFQRMSISTLATLFDGFDNEHFETKSVKDGPSKTKLVITNLVKSDKSKINITYVTRRFRDGWRIIDVVVDGGISEMKVRQSEYNLVLKKKGIPGLVSLLNNKADELMSHQ